MSSSRKLAVIHKNIIAVHVEGFPMHVVNSGIMTWTPRCAPVAIQT